MDKDQHIDADQQPDFCWLLDEIDQEELVRLDAIARARGTVVDVAALAIPLNFTFLPVYTGQLCTGQSFTRQCE